MKTKRFLATLLCLLMLASLFPASALADDGPAPAGLVDAAGETGTGTDEEPANEAEEEPADEAEEEPADETEEEPSDETVEDTAQEEDDTDPAGLEEAAAPAEPAKEPAESPNPEAAADTTPEPGTTTESAAEPSTESDSEDSSETTPEVQYPPFDQSKTVNGVTVRVIADEGVFPEGAVLSVAAVPTAQVESAIEGEREAGQTVAVSYTFDITILDANGNELQPADGQSVRVSFAAAQVADQNLDTQVYHVSDDGSAQALDVASSGRTATVETDGFSLYTVEFTYNTLEYVLSGGGSVKLETILSAVGLTGEAEAASVSDASLFSVSNETGEWIVTSHRAFTTTEWLRVTIAGVEYEITVTDDPGAVPYVDASGAAQTPVTEYTPVTASTTWTTGWYVVDANTTISTRIEISGDVHIILTDGCTLSTGGVKVAPGGSLTIWGQTEGSGTLIADGRHTFAPGIECTDASVTINGGTVTANGDSSGAGIGGGNGAGGTVTINGGAVTAKGEDGAAGIGGGYVGSGGEITITGGTVTASCFDGGQAIGHGTDSGESGILSIPGMKVTEPRGHAFGWAGGCLPCLRRGHAGGMRPPRLQKRRLPILRRNGAPRGGLRVAGAL